MNPKTNNPQHRSQNVHSLDRSASLVAATILVASGIGRSSRFPLWKLGIAAFLCKRAFTGHCEIYRAFGVQSAAKTAVLPYETGVKVRSSVTVKGDPGEVYAFWRNFDNLALFMQNVLSVETLSDDTYRWTVKGLKDSPLSWRAQLLGDIPGEKIAWASLPGGDVDSAGSVRFKPAPGGLGTEIHVEMQYNPPAGFVGDRVARILGRDPQTQVQEDLLRLKQRLETGEIPTIDGQSCGPRSPSIVQEVSRA